MTNDEQMRDALMQVSLSCSACPRHNCKGCTRPFASFMPAVRKALVLPRRNCDVGTAEEQSNRFEDYCMKHKNGGSCRECSFNENLNMCALEWAQTPYAQEGAAK